MRIRHYDVLDSKIFSQYFFDIKENVFNLDNSKTDFVAKAVLDETAIKLLKWT